MTHPDFSLGPPRAFRPIVPRMWPQQLPFLRYVEVPMSEAGVERDPVVSFEEYEAAKPKWLES